MQTTAEKSYFAEIRDGIASAWQGLRLSLRHFRHARRGRRKPIGVADEGYFAQETGIVTLTYPYEALPVPDNGRYRLHNEMEDCIVCDKCAEVCPVDCIEIEPVKSAEEIRKTSDGHSVRLYAAKFDIDMAKCCFCGLCTTVCPTECLTMTKTYDFSEFNVRDMIYHFSDLSPQQVEEKKQNYEVFQAAKQAAKTATATPSVETEPADNKPVAKEPVMKPVVKTNGTETTANTEPTTSEPSFTETPATSEPPKPVMKRPVIKPVIKK